MEDRGAKNRMELKLLKYEINKLYYEKIVPQKGIQLKANIETKSINKKIKNRKDCNFEFTLAVKDSDVVNIIVDITASFNVESIIENEQEFEYSAIEKIYPYIREVVANLTHTAEINALFLPIETIPIKKE